MGSHQEEYKVWNETYGIWERHMRWVTHPTDLESKRQIVQLRMDELKTQVPVAAGLITSKLQQAVTQQPTIILIEDLLAAITLDLEQILDEYSKSDDTIHPDFLASKYLHNIVKKFEGVTQDPETALSIWLGSNDFQQLLLIAQSRSNIQPKYRELWEEGRNYAIAQQRAGHTRPPDSEDTIATWTEPGQRGYKEQWNRFQEQLEVTTETEPNRPSTPITPIPIADPSTDTTWAGRSKLGIPGRYLERIANDTSTGDTPRS